MTIQLDFKDAYSDEYGEKYTNKMNYLVKVITEYTTGKDQFNVFNFEAGLGKSFTVNKLLWLLLNIHWDNRQRFLVVKRFIVESTSSVEYIEEQGFVKEAVLAITHENWSKYQYQLDKLADKKIIFISHQRYISLCENEEYKEAFSKGRDTLIIDEKVTFPVYTYNDKRYIKLLEILPNGLRASLTKVCKPLNKYIELQKTVKNTNKVIPTKFKINQELLDKFNDEVKIALSNNTIQDTEQRNLIKEFLRELKLFYSNQCVYNSGNISIQNPLHKHWGLKNNIILDASAKIDGAYLCNPKKFKILDQTRLIDHRNSTFNIIKFNSSKTKVQSNSQKYFDEIASKIIQNKKDTDNVLIVTHKDFSHKIKKALSLHNHEDIWIDKQDKANDEDYNNQSIAISWYGNLIGKNWAADFTQVWLISTPNIPIEQYLIHFLHYSDDKIGNKSTDFVRGRYKNDYFNSIQTGYIAAEMYQSLKRIQRNPKPKGDFFIVSEDEEIIDKVLSQIKNATNKNEIELDFVKIEMEEKEMEKQINKKPDQVDLFIQYILNEKKGIYKKSDIATKLQISKINRVLSDSRVHLFLNKRLHIHTRNIEII